MLWCQSETQPECTQAQSGDQPSAQRLVDISTMADQTRQHRLNVGKYSVVVKAVVFNSDTVLLMRRSDYIPTGAGEWDIPGGVLHMDEDPVEGLRREALEEAGIAIEIGQCFNCYWFGDVGAPHHLGLTFLAQYASGCLTPSAEHTHVAWYGVESLPEQLPDWIETQVQQAIALRAY